MRAIIFSGGGSKGAYQVGAASYLLGEAGINYDIFCGVSVGALNGAMLSMFKAGEERDASASLLSVWRGISTKKILRHWHPFAFLHAPWKPSLYDSRPLIDLVRSQMDAPRIRTSGKKLIVGTVSLNTSQYRTFDQDHPAIVEAVLASSSFPGMFCPIEIEGQLWTDGCLKNSTLLRSAIDAGATQIDVVMATPPPGSIDLSKHPSSLDIIVRSIDMIADEIMESDLKVTQLMNKLVDAGKLDKKRVEVRILRPTHRLPGKSLEFDQKSIRYMIDLGYNDAAAFYKDLAGQ